MKNSVVKIVVILGVMVACLCTLSFLQGRMNGIREEEHLTDSKPLENAPPMVAFTSVALGGFRGLLADYLWLRSGQMQEQGKYYEMVQLADWIVKLQPRFTSAHAFLAWNMAYNVSVTYTDKQDRWRWVKRGIELIRDQAMEYNPTDPELFRQLGWIYQHKMGQEMDDANLYYKQQMAREMIRLFGDYYGEWEILDKAPLTEAKLLAVLGDKAAGYQQVMAECGLNFMQLEGLFREYAVIPDRLPENEKFNLRGRLEQIGAAKDVELCLRHRWILYKYRLDPKMIMKVIDIYGKLDFRLPEAHAIYWAEKGREQWFSEAAKFKRLNCDRMIFQSLNNAVQTGRLLYLKGDLNNLLMMPNLDVADAAKKAYEDAQKEFPDMHLQGPFINFLVDGIVRLYSFGQEKKASEWFQYAKTLNAGRFAGDLETFVNKEVAEDMESASRRQAQATIESYLLQAFIYRTYAENEESDEYKDSEALLRTAAEIYAHYASFIKGTELRRRLPPFEQIAGSILYLVYQEFDNQGENGKARAQNLSRWLPRPRLVPIGNAADTERPDEQ